MLELTWYGNASVKAKLPEGSIVFDPFISRNADHAKLEPEELADAKAVFVTHGHFDHVADLGLFASKLGIPVYAPAEVTASLRKNKDFAQGQLRPIHPGESLSVGGASVMVYAANHIHFDLALVASTMRRALLPRNLRSLAAMIRLHAAFPMGRCVAYLLEADGKRLLHFGSLALDPAESYPQALDVLSLPFQGSSYLDHYALDAVRRLQPRNVYLHHFDDAFPPLSQDVPLDAMRHGMERDFPDRPLLIPEYRKALVIQ